MRIDVSNYIFSHGKQPHGKGSWAFNFHVPRVAGARADRLKVVTEPAPGGTQLWIEAKRWALKRGIQLGAYRVEAAPDGWDGDPSESWDLGTFHR